MARFEGKSVVITGATGDIGPAVARHFAAEGARLGLTYRARREQAEALARELGSPGRSVVLVPADLLVPTEAVGAEVRRAAAALLAALGGVDVLVALAGYPATPELWQRPFENVTATDLHAAFAVDTVGTFLFAQALAPALRAARGSIVVMSSSAALYGDTLGLLYAPAKCANAGLVKVLARVLAPEVRVNGVAPGAVDSAWVATLTEEQRVRAVSTSLLGRLGRPDEIARLIADLASPGFVNGRLVAADGGIFPRS